MYIHHDSDKVNWDYKNNPLALLIFKEWVLQTTLWRYYFSCFRGFTDFFFKKLLQVAQLSVLLFHYFAPQHTNQIHRFMKWEFTIRLEDQYNPLILSALFHKLYHNLHTESITLGELDALAGNTYNLLYKKEREYNKTNVIFFLLTITNPSWNLASYFKIILSLISSSMPLSLHFT